MAHPLFRPLIPTTEGGERSCTSDWRQGREKERGRERRKKRQARMRQQRDRRHLKKLLPAIPLLTYWNLQDR